MQLLWTVLIGAAVGAHASTWGMYKDAPHEGFTWPKYLRSLLLAALVAPLVSRVFRVVPVDAASAVILFGCIYSMERAILEAWKTFFRAEDQSKYAIPMQLAVFGKTVRSRRRRFLFGIIYVGLILLGIVLLSRYHLPPAPRRCSSGQHRCAGRLVQRLRRSWKDAPIEGFRSSVFRSPLIAAGFSICCSASAPPVQGVFGHRVHSGDDRTKDFLLSD
jgi:hypothetical protein